VAPEDLSLLALAAAQWQESLLSRNAQAALRKVEALHGAIDRAMIDLSFIQRETPRRYFRILWAAINGHREVSFSYRSRTLTHRRVQPLALVLIQRTMVFSVGLDIEKRGA
jgi:predicted DNA-binding transcriptional regulator YafY